LNENRQLLQLREAAQAAQATAGQPPAAAVTEFKRCYLCQQRQLLQLRAQGMRLQESRNNSSSEAENIILVPYFLRENTFFDNS
jgi:hypothetical protein